MLTFLKGALKKLPPFKALVQQRQSLQARLTSAEEQLHAAQAELESIHARLPNLEQVQQALGRESIASALDKYGKGHRFRSALITHPYSLSESDWKHLERGYEGEAKIQEWMKRVRNHTLVTYDGLLSLADQVRYCEETNLPGCYVEAGTWKGGASALMALANLEYGKSRRQFYLFDSFQGIPEPDAVLDDIPWIQNEMKLSLDQCNGKLRSVDCIVAPQKDLEDVFFNIAGYPREKVDIVAGWFQETLPKTVDRMGPIAILRLDGDLYDSIRVCLEALYPLLVEGGFLVIDDWCLSGARKAVTDYFAQQGQQPYMCYADWTVRYFIKPHRR